MDVDTLNLRSGTLRNVFEINGGAAISKTTGATLIMEGTNSYSGPTNVTTGTLLVNGDNSGATGDVTVFSGATLGGNGTVGGDTLINGLLSPGGSSPDTLTFAGTLVDVSDVDPSGLLFDLGASSDLVNLTSGELEIGGSLGVSDFTFTQGPGFGFGEYTLFSTPTTLSGGLGDTLVMFSPSVVGVLSFADSDTDLILTVASVPEPSACLMAALSLLPFGLFGWRRRSRA
jgi:fibronectin-binding autotransporter adhesin